MISKEEIEKALNNLWNSLDDKLFNLTYSQEEMQEDLRIVLKELEKLQEENGGLKLKERNRNLGMYGEIEVHDLINKTLQEDYIEKDKIREKLQELERLQEENNKLKRANKTYINSIQSITPVLLEDYIEKDKIREKLQELEKEYTKALKENTIKAFILKSQIEILKELLEGK